MCVDVGVYMCGVKVLLRDLHQLILNRKTNRNENSSEWGKIENYLVRGLLCYLLEVILINKTCLFGLFSLK